MVICFFDLVLFPFWYQHLVLYPVLVPTPSVVSQLYCVAMLDISFNISTKISYKKQALWWFFFY